MLFRPHCRFTWSKVPPFGWLVVSCVYDIRAATENQCPNHIFWWLDCSPSDVRHVNKGRDPGKYLHHCICYYQTLLGNEIGVSPHRQDPSQWNVSFTRTSGNMRSLSDENLKNPQISVHLGRDPRLSNFWQVLISRFEPSFQYVTSFLFWKFDSI